jgi:hypothetical protein
MPVETVLLVCPNEAEAARLTGLLDDRGFGVVGPVARVREALALIGHAPASAAIVAGTPTGRRSASELANSLVKLWGIPTLIIDHDGDVIQDRNSQHLRPRLIERLRDTLENRGRAYSHHGELPEAPDQQPV